MWFYQPGQSIIATFNDRKKINKTISCNKINIMIGEMAEGLIQMRC